jgi:hypothetical protein
MKSLAALFAATLFGIAPTLAQNTTTTRTTPWGSNGTRTTVESSDGSSLTRSTIREYDGTYTTRDVYVPPRPPSNYQPMTGYCPMGNCK